MSKAVCTLGSYAINNKSELSGRDSGTRGKKGLKGRNALVDMREVEINSRGRSGLCFQVDGSDPKLWSGEILKHAD